MKYTTYFSEYVKQSGPPRISERQFRRMMNVVSLEMQLSTINYVKKDLTDTPFSRRYDLVIRSLTDKIGDLTRNMDPAKLMREFGQLSQHEINDTFEVERPWDEDEGF